MDKIPIPVSVRLRRWGPKAVQLLVFFGTAALVLLLFTRR